MSMTFYTNRKDRVEAVGSHGPLDQFDMEWWEMSQERWEGTPLAEFYAPRTLDPTPEQEVAAGSIMANFHSSKAIHIAEMIGFTFLEGDNGACADPETVLHNIWSILDVDEIGEELELALQQIIPVCNAAIEWHTDLLVC